MTAAPSRDHGGDARSEPAAGASFLAGIRGNGTMQVLRDRHDGVAEVAGTWRPLDPDTDLADLQRSVEGDEPVRFEGRLQDSARPDRDEVVARVVIRSYGDYVFDAAPEEGEPGTTLRVFNLRPVDETEVVSG